MARILSLPKPADLASLARSAYAAELKAAPRGTKVLSPVATTRALAEKFGGGTARVASPVARVYYAENGRRNPLPIPADATPAKLRDAILARRFAPTLSDGSGISADGNATLGRWETIAASAAASLGRRVSPAEVKRIASEKYEETWIGRGTKAAAPSAR
jgi:hypothetical protein